MSRGAVAIKAKGVLAVRRRVAANPLRGGLNQPAGDHRGRGTIRAKLPTRPPARFWHMSTLCATHRYGCGSTGDGPVHQHYGREYPAAVVCFTDGAAVDREDWGFVGAGGN